MPPSGSSFTALRSPMVDPKTGIITWTWIQQFVQWQRQLANGLDSAGNLVSNIEPTVAIVGRAGTLGTILQFLGSGGVIEPAGLPAATPAAQGAVVLPAGAASNQLGSAALEPAVAFDAAGAAAAAQAAAETYAAAEAAAAQAAAETYASNASNLTTGTVAVGRLPGISVTITTAALTGGGTQGSMTFTNGVLTAQTPAT